MFYVRHLAKYSSELTGKIQRSRGLGGLLSFCTEPQNARFREDGWLASV